MYRHIIFIFYLFYFFFDFYHFDIYRSLLCIFNILHSCIILVLMGLVPEYQTDIFFSFSRPFFFFTFFWLSFFFCPFQYSRVSPLRFMESLWLCYWQEVRCIFSLWWWNSKSNLCDERVMEGSRGVIVESNSNVSSRNLISPRPCIQTSIVIVATVEIDIARVTGDKATTARIDLVLKFHADERESSGLRITKIVGSNRFSSLKKANTLTKKVKITGSN